MLKCYPSNLTYWGLTISFMGRNTVFSLSDLRVWKNYRMIKCSRCLQEQGSVSQHMGGCVLS